VVLALRIALRRALDLPAPRLAVTFKVSYLTEAREVRPVRDGAQVVSRPASSEIVFKRLRAPLHALAGILTARCADAVVACSRYTAREVAHDYGIEPEPQPIPNGLADVGDEPPARLGRDGPVRALFAGRLRTRKAVAVLLEALARPELTGLALTIVGDGEQRQALERRAAELGLGDRCRFAGLVARDEIARRYADADLFVLPSTYEGFPVAILEAMAAGLPIVATTVAGIPEAVEHGVSGLLVEREDAAGLAAALAELVGDPERRRTMGAAARQRVLERFTIDRVGRDYLELWRSLTVPGVAA